LLETIGQTHKTPTQQNSNSTNHSHPFVSSVDRPLWQLRCCPWLPGSPDWAAVP